MTRTPVPADDAEADFRRLFDQHYGRVLSYARRRASQASDAEDAAAETFAVAWRRFGDKPPIGVELAWLYGIARRVLANQRRGQKRLSSLMERLAELTPRRPSEISIDAEPEVESILAALQRLRREDQEILRLAAWERLSHAELGVALGCSENAATIRLHRARKRLDDEMKGIASAGHSLVEGRIPDQEVAER